MHRSSIHNRHRLLGCLSNHIAVDVTAILQLVSRQCRTMGRSKLQQIYYDPKRVGSYGGVAALRKVVSEKNVEQWLSEQDAYTLHKPVIRHFKRRCVVVGGPNQQWQAVLVDMSRLKKSNDGTTFLLTVIDVFSKRAWCIPLKNKSAASLVAAFKQLLRERSPITLQTDKGSEFLNRSLQKLLTQYGVHHFSTHNEETKASIVERFNRTLKTRMWRYFTKNQSVRYLDVLQDFVRSYNKTYHRSIGMAPSEVNGTNQESVWQRLYGHEGGGTPKFRIGDRVRISKAKRHFEKGYMANWTEELFTIVDAHRSDPIRPCIVWSTGTAIHWTARSMNRSCRRSPCRRTRRIESNTSYTGVTRKRKHW